MSNYPKFFLKKSNKHQGFKGYTLIEILIGIVILSILFSIGFAGFRDFSRRQSLEVLARKIKGDLALIREKAISGEKPYNDEYEGMDIKCSAPNTLSGYSFRVITNHNYILEAVCLGGAVEVKNVKISDNLEISVPSPNPIFFKVLSKGTNVLSTPAEIIITQTESEKSFNISVTESGEIK